MRAAKVKIKIHPTAIIAIAFFIWNKGFAKLLAAVLLHELGHSLAARALGRKNQVLTLTPLGCSLYVGELTGSAAVAVYLAGPVVSLLLLPLLYPQTLWVFAFNILPVMPLDGGRVLAALAGERRCELAGGLVLLALTELCLLNAATPVGLTVILYLHSRWLASAQFVKIRRAADFLRDLY